MTVTAIDVRARSTRVVRTLNAVPLLTFYLILLMGIPSRLQFAPLGGLGTPSNIFAFIIFFWYLLAWLHPASGLYRDRQPIRLAAVIWFSVILAAYVSATQHSMPALELNAADRGVMLAAAWVGVLLVAADGLSTLNQLQTLIRRIVWGATAIATLGIIQFFSGLDVAKYIVIPGLSSQQPFISVGLRDSFNRPSATAIHPIEFGVVLAMCLPLAIHQARFAPPGIRLRRWLQVAVIGTTLPMTVSRSAILGLIISGFVILSVWPKKDRRMAYLVVLASAVVMRAVIPGLLGTIRGLFTSLGSDSSAIERTGAISLASPFISQHPWLGRGFGTFLPTTYFFTDDQYLNSLIDTGIVGMLALMALIATGWFVARRSRRISTDEEIRHLAQCLAASSAVALVSFATFDALSFTMATGITFLVLGCAGALWKLTSIEGEISPVPSGARPLFAGRG